MRSNLLRFWKQDNAVLDQYVRYFIATCYSTDKKNVTATCKNPEQALLVSSDGDSMVNIDRNNCSNDQLQ